jgi:ABC-type antimicrobial peptide transport system permease subunit
MFKNYVKIFLRTMRRQKLYSLITIAGLSIGLACSILVMLFVQAELSFEKCHEKRDDLYRVVTETSSTNETAVSPWFSPIPLGPALKSDYPEVEDFARLVGPSWLSVKLKDNLFTEKFVASADPSFFRLFNFHFLQGDPETALSDLASVVLTDETAERYFGNENPMGKVFTLDGKDVQVKGVVRIPRNTHFRFTMVRTFQASVINRQRDPSSWANAAAHGTYIQLRANVRLSEFNKKINNIIKEHDPQASTTVFLQPLNRVHLHSPFQYDYHNLNKGSMTYIYVLSAVAFCLLLIACINFINLSTAQSNKRAKEIGVRKVHGAERKNLVRQFLGETVFFSFLSLFFALELISLFLPVFNRLSDRQIVMADLLNLPLLFGLFSITLLTGLLAGAYPALFLSSFSSLRALKGFFHTGTQSRAAIRKVLVITQFTIALVLLIGTIVIHGQLHYMQTKDLGLDLDNVLMFAGLNQIQNIETFKNELRQNPHVIGLTQSLGPVVGFDSSSDVDWDGKDPSEKIVLYQCFVDYAYLDIFKIDLAKGRFFSKEISSDKSNFLLNETAVRVTGMDSPIGKRFAFNGSEGEIIGVLKDFHTAVPREPIPPLVFQIHENTWLMYVKIDDFDTAGTISYIRRIWEKHVPDRPFYYDFVDEELSEFYENDIKLSRIFTSITLLTLFVAGIGLFGLSSYLTEQRTKEIGIRKVLGSSVRGIVSLLSKEFVKWTIISNVIAWPIAYLIMRRWLQSYAFRMKLGWEIFVLSALGSLVLVLLAVCYRTIKTAVACPVDSLRYE